MCENSVLEGDGDFNEERLFYSRNNVMSKIANLIMRSCGAKFNIARAVESYQNKLINESTLDSFAADKQIKEKYQQLMNDLNNLTEKVGKNIETYQMIRATDELWNVISQANQLFQLSEPWSLDVSNESELRKQDAIIFASIETARLVSILLKPFMPELSNTFLDRMSVDVDHRDTGFAKVGCDVYGSGANRSGDAPMQKLKKRS